jgi:SAM-dependent methyltransferase
LIHQHYDFARFYDWTYQGYEVDLSFFVRLAEKYGSPILEVACGSGRIMIPLAKRGFQVVGIDLSEHMLDYARAKLDDEVDSVRSNATLVQADMRSFDLGKTFAAVFVPNASVFHLHDRESLLACACCLYDHTSPGGAVVVDVVSPRRMSNQRAGVEVLVREGINPSTGLLTREFNKKLAIDREDQMVTVLHTYVECVGSEEKSYACEQSYRWVEKDEGVAILAAAGFADIETIGDYNVAPYDNDSPRLILAARRVG